MKKLLFIVAVISGLLGSCTKYENPAPRFEEYELPPDSVKTRKILLLVVDGAVGSIVKEVMPTNIAALLPHSKYSFESLTNENTSTASSWTTIMTGTNTDVHHVVDDSYISKPDNSDHQHAPVEYSPSFIFRLKDSRESINVLTFTRDLGMSNALMVDANSANVYESDVDVKDAVVQTLGSRNPDVVVAQFTDVLHAGTSSSFTESSSTYTQAIRTVDQYIGEIMTGLRARENYPFEDWLVIITSNHGGIDNTYGGSSFSERNTFSIYHQPDFADTELNAELMQSLRFWGHNSGTQTTGIRAIQPDDDSYFSMVKHNEMTIELKMRSRIKTVVWPTNNSPVGNYSYWYSPVVSKKSNTNTANTGWGLFKWNENIAFCLSDGVIGDNVQVARPNGDVWGIITARVRKSGSDAVFSIFRDGILAQEKTLNNFNFTNANSTAQQFIVGFRNNISYELPDFDLSSLRIWSRALTNDEVSRAACSYELENDLAGNIIGEWKFLNASQTDVANSFDGKNLLFERVGDPFFILSSDYSPCQEAGSTNVLLQSVDVATQIFYWFGIQPQANWRLQGSVFLSNYEIEFLK